MTWGEFKRKVDEELAQQGGDDETEIWYIDVTNASTAEWLCVDMDDISASISTTSPV
jgi:hypothetical protein